MQNEEKSNGSGTELEFHEVASIFPLIEGEDFEQLVADIRTHGVREPVWMFEGKILDGRNRYRAARVVGTEIRQRQYTGTALDAIGFVWSLNRARRHLSSSQAAIADAKRNKMTDAYEVVRQAAKERQGERTDLKPNIVELIPQCSEPSPNASDQPAASVESDPWPKATTCDLCGGKEYLGQEHLCNPKTTICHLCGGRKYRGEVHLCNSKSRDTTADAEGERSDIKPNIPELIPESAKPRSERKTRDIRAKVAGTNAKYIDIADKLVEERPDLVADIEAGKKTITQVQREIKKEEYVARLADVAAREIEAPTGVYDVIVIDPPWPMEKIERDVRPNQVAFEYPTMTEAELRQLAIPSAEDCHVWLWTTHKFMPMALRLLEAWNMKYVCTFVWHKPGGFQPIGLPQFNCEFAIYARVGVPSFIDTKAFNTCFTAPRGKHSEKPEEFYEILRRVTGGRRLDMFNRRVIDGFTSWGKEAAT